MRDVIILGAGPAALSTAVACGEQGLSVLVLGGEASGWPANYGSWADELEAVGLGDHLGPIWRETLVHLGDDGPTRLGRPYARVAKRRLRAHLLRRCEALGVRILWTRALGVVHGAEHSEVTEVEGTVHTASVVLDGTGARSSFTVRPREARSFQAAYGVLASVRHHPWSTDEMTLMDFRPAPGDDAHGSAAPTFLYVMPMGPRRVFVEETSLMRAPALPFAVLRDRLMRRLAHLGVEVEEVHERELCLIPMDAPRPVPGQRTVALGAAASLVHPATGYSLGRSFRAAPRVAEALARALDRGVSAAARSRAVQQAVWPASAVVQHELFGFGRRIVEGLDHDDTVAFFRAFFSTHPETWAAYLAGDAGVGPVLGAMASMFTRSSPRIRRQLLAAGLSWPVQRLRLPLVQES